MSDHSLEMEGGESSGSDHSESKHTTRRWKRAGAAVIGGLLLIRGLKRRSLVGPAMVLVGGWLSYRALSRGISRKPSPGESTDEAMFERSITVDRSEDDLSAFVRDPGNLERIVHPFAEVTSEGDNRHTWVVNGPFGRELEWETRLVDEDSEDRLRWVPTEGTAIVDDWSVSFEPAPGDRGTEVTFRGRFDPPGGMVGTAALSRLDVVPEVLVGTALDRFKSLAETGEIPTISKNPSARGRGDLL